MPSYPPSLCDARLLLVLVGIKSKKKSFGNEKPNEGG